MKKKGMNFQKCTFKPGKVENYVFRAKTNYDITLHPTI